MTFLQNLAKTYAKIKGDIATCNLNADKTSTK